MTPIPPGEPLNPSDRVDRPLTMPLLVHGGVLTKMTCLVIALGLFGFVFSVIGTLAIALGGTIREVTEFWVVAAATGLPAIFMHYWNAISRRWLEVTVTGFVLTRRGEKITVRDDQVIAVWQHGKVDDWALYRQIRLEIDCRGEVETIWCRYSSLLSQGDPLAALVDRVTSNLVRRTREGLARGAALSGKRWRFDRQGLHCLVAGRSTIYPLEYLSAVGHYGKDLCVWKGEEERPFLCIPSRSRNAYPLGVLLREAIHSNPTRGMELPGKPLGRILLDHRGPVRQDVMKAIAWSVFLWLALTTVGLLCATPFERNVCLTVSLLPLAVLGLGILKLGRSSRATIRFHEAGVSQVGRDGVRELAYTEVESMTWKDGKVIVFQPSPRCDRRAIHYRSSVRDESAGLTAFRNHAANTIARRWLVDLDKSAVIWTPRLRFLPDCLEYRREGMFGSAELQTVGYEKINGYRFNGSWFELYVAGQEGSVMMEWAESVNFFPGLALLNLLNMRHQGAAGDVDVKTLAPRLKTTGTVTQDMIPLQLDARITVSAPAWTGFTPEIPNVDRPADDEE
jgi:hypothetical protein